MHRRAFPPPFIQLNPFLSRSCVLIAVVVCKETSRYQFNTWTAGTDATLLQKEYVNLLLSPYILKILTHNSGYIKQKTPPQKPTYVSIASY